MRDNSLGTRNSTTNNINNINNNATNNNSAVFNDLIPGEIKALERSVLEGSKTALIGVKERVQSLRDAIKEALAGVPITPPLQTVQEACQKCHQLLSQAKELAKQLCNTASKPSLPDLQAVYAKNAELLAQKQARLGALQGNTAQAARLLQHHSAECSRIAEQVKLCEDRLNAKKEEEASGSLPSKPNASDGNNNGEGDRQRMCEWLKHALDVVDGISGGLKADLLRPNNLLITMPDGQAVHVRVDARTGRLLEVHNHASINNNGSGVNNVAAAKEVVEAAVANNDLPYLIRHLALLNGQHHPQSVSKKHQPSLK